MHARVTVAHPQPDRFEEARAAVPESFLPAAREQPGYQGFLLLADRASGQLVGITFWESETAMQNSGGSGGYYQQQMADFANMLVSPPVTTNHEVVVREP
jgi:heme-degrading monooxygenase HmoA